MPIGPRQPSEQVVEAAVLHHHHDNVIDLRGRRRRQGLRVRIFCCGKGPSESSGRRDTGHITQKISTIDTHLLLAPLQEEKIASEAAIELQLASEKDARRCKCQVNAR
jgi:hypothetical protein